MHGSLVTRVTTICVGADRGSVLVNNTAEGGMARYQDPVKRPVICSEEWFKEK
eukprot:COSAG01_NODE_9855_length_2319_cov_5.499550_1_plen_52_part_10